LAVKAREDKAKPMESDEKRAVAMGKALLDHRLAHHVTDDYEFENSATKYYSFIQDENADVQTTHKILSSLISLPNVYHQGKLEIRSQTLFGSEYWRSCYGVLDEPGTKPRRMHLYKRQSAAGLPIAQYAIEDCVCSLSECLDCKSGHYCFTLRARKGNAKDEAPITLCADHSKKQEGWLAALMEAGVRFEKEDAGDVANIKSIFELSARKLVTHEEIPLSQYKGQVCLVVNVASK